MNKTRIVLKKREIDLSLKRIDSIFDETGHEVEDYQTAEKLVKKLKIARIRCE